MNIQAWQKRGAFASMIGMFLILIQGALVTKTDSGRGCGDDWPLCNGRFVPAYTLESMIEYSHRFVVGVVGLILLATTVLVFLYSKRKDAKWYVGGAMFFTVLQAILGALAVVMPQSSAVMALHFGFSLLAFAFTLLLAMVYTKYGGVMLNGIGAPIPSGIRKAIWMIIVYCYVVVYLGAFVRHTEAWGGCIGWPLCNGQVIPEMVGDTAIVFVHRIAAAVFGITLGVFYLIVRRSMSRYGESGRGLVQASLWAFLFVLGQIASGAAVTLTIGNDWFLLASLVHAVLISCLFAVLCFIAVLTLRARN